MHGHIDDWLFLPCVIESEYRAMVKDKTGGLFRMCFKLMQAFSSATRDFSVMIDLLGLYFQIRDDYVNLTRYTLLSVFGALQV